MNELSLEAYLYAVVPSEMYASMPLEALKAQAIAARTYTLRSLGRYASRGFECVRDPPPHPSTAASTASILERPEPSTRPAAKCYAAGGALIERCVQRHARRAFGSKWLDAVERTATSRLAWTPMDSMHPHLLVPADLDAWLTSFPPVYGNDIAARSAFRWVQPISVDRLQAIVDARAQIGRIVQVIARERGVKRATSRGSSLSVLRVLTKCAVTQFVPHWAGVRSNLFRIETMYGDDGFPSEFLIIGGGFGHGVGMDQTGAAAGRAEAGQTVNEILAYYYPGARIEQAYASSIPADAH